MITLVVILVVVGVFTGWLASAVVRARRPYGVIGDVFASVFSMLILGIPEWELILPAIGMGFERTLPRMLISIGNPFCLALVVLWLLRKFKVREG